MGHKTDSWEEKKGKSIKAVDSRPWEKFCNLFIPLGLALRCRVKISVPGPEL